MSVKQIELWKHTVFLFIKPPVIKRKQIFQESVKKKFTSKHFIVIYWANYKQKQLISIYNNKNGLITACIVYALFDCNCVSGKKHYKVLCLYFIDNSNNYIIALEIAYYCFQRAYTLCQCVV